jgi:hypothetical protein
MCNAAAADIAVTAIRIPHKGSMVFGVRYVGMMGYLSVSFQKFKLIVIVMFSPRVEHQWPVFGHRAGVLVDNAMKW